MIKPKTILLVSALIISSCRPKIKNVIVGKWQLISVSSITNKNELQIMGSDSTWTHTILKSDSNYIHEKIIGQFNDDNTFRFKNHSATPMILSSGHYELIGNNKISLLGDNLDTSIYSISTDTLTLKISQPKLDSITTTDLIEKLIRVKD